MTVTCKHCEKTFNTSEGLHEHTKAKHPQEIKKSFSLHPKTKEKMRNWAIAIAIIILVIWAGSKIIEGQRRLPPTDMAGHIEESPKSHILKEPMPIAIQKHMLEHSDGSGPGAAIINYNCRAFECEEGLIENLEAFAAKYPKFVYVTPYHDMDVKIALTRLGKAVALDEYDGTKIDAFIRETGRQG